MTRVLVVDDDRRMRRTLQVMMERMGFESVAAESAAEALERVRDAAFDLVLTDLRMPEVNGIELLERIRADHPTLPVILITAYGTIQTAVEAMRKGASDYVLKPFDNESLRLVIQKTLDFERFRSQNVFLKQQVGERWAAEDLFLNLPSMREVAAYVDKVAPSASPVLVTGETGTGKELAARCIHGRSPRRENLFVPLNCAALPGELLEAELFGHARGAFTGADRDRVGKFEIAHGGTLFLDEIGDMPLSLQSKLLRVLEDSVVEPIGSNRRLTVDVRIISATNQDIERAIAEKRFRGDLYYRLNTFELRLAPLRERAADIDVLAPLFLARSARDVGKAPPRLSDEALELLKRHDWPGNVRELRNLMERAAVLSTEPLVGADFFASTIHAPPPAPPVASDEPPAAEAELSLGEALDRFERRVLLRALDAAGDNKAEAARRLGISERNLWYKLKKHGL
jgi:two-component system, NtrC family, response regulator AtoC